MMMIDIPNDEKSHVGKIIEFARKQKNITIETLINGICSKQTYYKIKKSIISESEIYDSLLSKLNLYYDYTCTPVPSYDSLWKYFLDQNWDMFDREVQKIKFELSDLDVYRYIIKITIELIEKDMDIALAKEILPLLPDVMKEIVSYFILRYLYTEELKYDSDFSYLSLNTTINKCEYLLILIKGKRYYDASILCNSLLETTKGKMHYSVLIEKLFIIQAIQPQAFDECCDEIIHDPYFIQNSDSANDFMYNVGMFHYVREDYNKAWLYLSDICQNHKYRVPGMIFLCHMETITNYRLNEHCLTEVCEMSREEPYKVLLKYYQMKYDNIDFNILEDYLWHNCRGIIAYSYPQDVVKKIIHDELFWIADKTGDKRRYYQFNKKMNQ